MRFNRSKTIIEKITYWITRLALLNFYFILFTLLGLVIFGFFPAVTSSLSIARKWILGKRDIKILSHFKKTYRKEFLSANGIGWILILIGGILYLNYFLILNFNSKFVFAVIFSFYFVTFFYLILTLWIFPLLVHYKTNFINYLKKSVIIGLSKLHITISILFILFTIGYYSLEFPALIIFLSFSLFSVLWMWLPLRVFWQIDNRSN